jgi:hypothetical protein
VKVHKRYCLCFSVDLSFSVAPGHETKASVDQLCLPQRASESVVYAAVLCTGAFIIRLFNFWPLELQALVEGQHELALDHQGLV